MTPNVTWGGGPGDQKTPEKVLRIIWMAPNNKFDNNKFDNINFDRNKSISFIFTLFHKFDLKNKSYWKLIYLISLVKWKEQLWIFI